jgi:O-antigen ligase
LEPVVAMFAVRFITPIIGDYINALILANAIVVSFFITCYLYFVQKLLNDKFQLSPLSNFCIIVLFVLLHFLILKTKETGNDHLLYAEDCNCYYHSYSG